MSSLAQDFAFQPPGDDPLGRLTPDHRFDLEDLRSIQPPPTPEGFEEFWSTRYARVRERDAAAAVVPTGRVFRGLEVFDLSYESTDGMTIGGWVTMPKNLPARRGLVVGHGYGGRMGPDLRPPVEDAVVVYPCCRGIGRSATASIPDDPWRHVLQGIEEPTRYVLGGCVEDLWMAVSVLLELAPQVAGRIGFVGASFCGGLGALALAWEERVRRGYLSVPSFGHTELRLRLPTQGSGLSVQQHIRKNPVTVRRTLELHDAAVAARRIRIPMHCSCALRDPVVTPPGQFAVFNALPGPKELTVLASGHSPEAETVEAISESQRRMAEFFAPL